MKLSGFGSFVVRRKRARVGRNPKSGKTAPIPARRVMFKPSPVLKQSIQRKTAPVDGGLPTPAQVAAEAAGRPVEYRNLNWRLDNA